MNIAELGTSDLEAELVGLAGQLAATQCRFLRLLAEFDARGAWAGPGMRSCAHWLSWRIGMDLRTAREQLRVARALPTLPLVATAFGDGRISYAKTRAITRIATPQTEGYLLEVALAGTASHLERVVQLARTAGANAAAAVTARRSVRWEWAEDGSLLLRARLPGDQGAMLLTTLEAFLEPEREADLPADAAQNSTEWDQSDPAEQPGASLEGDAAPGWNAAQAEKVAAASEHAPGAALDRVAARRADALLALAEAAHEHGIADHSGPRSDRFDVVVHVQAGPGTAEIEGGPAIPLSTATRLACQARVSALITDHRSNPLYLGRRRRLVSPRQLRALHARDHGRCRFPGCSSEWVEAHHIVPWLIGGRTDITNLVLVCGFHHGLIHDHGYQIRKVGGDLEFHRPDGTSIPIVGRPITGLVEELVEAHAAQQLEITSDSLTPTWSGETLDPDPILLRLLGEPIPGRAA